MIPFNKPYVPEASKRYALEALESDHQQGDGPFTARASRMVSDLVGGGYVLLTPSCTHALEMASMLGNFGPGDEVILPSYTFTSAATAVTQFGATPVFVDIDPTTKGIDASQVADAVTDKTVAISWVNYAGVAPDIEALQTIAREKSLLLIEDNAHGLGGSYKGRPLGSFGDFATQSFHATKNIQCGEGGALVINNPEFLDRAEIIREKGTNRKNFILGQVSKYQWVDKGSSYLLAEVLAAALCGQLENYTYIQRSRVKVFKTYFKIFEGLERISTSEPQDANGDNNVAHMFYYLARDEQHQTQILQALKSKGIDAASHYQPLHESKFGQHFPSTINNEDYSKSFATRVVRLPLWTELSKQNIEFVCEQVPLI